MSLLALAALLLSGTQSPRATDSLTGPGVSNRTNGHHGDALSRSVHPFTPPPLPLPLLPLLPLLLPLLPLLPLPLMPSPSRNELPSSPCSFARP